MKLGDHTIPDNPNRLPFLIDVTKKIYDTYHSDTIKNANKNDALAQLLEFKSSNNGAYWNRLAALKAYGLLEGRGDIRVSQLGKDTTYGTGQTRAEAVLKAFLNISLWKSLYEAHRLELPSQDFWAKLQKIANCEPPVAKSGEAFIREAFEEDAKVIRSIKQEVIEETILTPPEQTTQGISGTPHYIEIRAGPYFHRLPFTAQGKKVALEALQLIEVPESKPPEKPTKGEK